MLDIISGFGFLANLSVVPEEYKQKIEVLCNMGNNGSLSSSDIAEATTFFRNESWKYKNTENDRSHFANAMLMLTIALDAYKHLYDRDMEEV